MSEFNSVTISILASNEKRLLTETLDEIISTCSMDDIEEIVVALKNENCPSANALKEYLAENTYGKEKIRAYIQEQSLVDKCIAYLAQTAKGSHLIILSADKEMNPLSVHCLIEKAKEEGDSIVCGAKWLKESEIHGKMNIHLLGSKMLNKITALILGKDCYDPCSLFRIVPVELLKEMEIDFSADFIYEYALKPIAYGKKYYEIPTVFHRRDESRSNIKLILKFICGTKYLHYAVKYKIETTGKVTK